MQEKDGALNGYLAEQAIRIQLRQLDYAENRVKTIEQFRMATGQLFPVAGQFAYKCEVPLVAHYHEGAKLRCEVDFLLYTSMRDFVCLSIKSQMVDGTADEKLEYEINQLVASELSAAMLVVGPVRGRDAEQGWRFHVLKAIWDRTLKQGMNRVLLFRKPEKLSVWLRAGAPVAGGGRNARQIFVEYCDMEP
jgi:hypothetical protein